MLVAMRQRERVWLGVGLVLIMASVGLRVWREAAPVRRDCGEKCASRFISATTATPSSAVVASSVSGAEAARLRACSEARYRCGKATLVFVHVHKGGGTTFVATARGNRAGLARNERNGDPVSDGGRQEWWRLSPATQARWFRTLRRKKGVRFVATEKGFPSANLLAPVDLVYAIVIREPASRFVSYYFWRWRDKSLKTRTRVALWRSGLLRGGLNATLAPNAPSFDTFVDAEAPLDGYYVRRLLGVEDPRRIVVEGDLLNAQRVLSDVFSLVLITEHLADFQPLLADILGWRDTNFAAFYRKNNPPPDLSKLAAWRPDWRAEIKRRIPLDSRFYRFAAALATDRLAKGEKNPP
mmetsp:Transcript_12597/g.41296  ORF Transcript_12597/g.41296 Transcript_12597/m.41296 type:complete len:354 (-) Transcript_12597:1717-2778(-)